MNSSEKNELEAIKTLETHLAKDMEFIQNNLSDGSNEMFWRRMFIQTLYSHLETTVIMMKLSTKYSTEIYTPTVQELYIINAQTFSIKENGVIETKPAKTNLISDLMFALKLFHKSSGSKKFEQIDSKNLNTIKAFIKARNRIIHPKSKSDLDLSFDDLNKYYLGWEWLQTEYTNLLKQKREYLEIKINQLQEQLNQ